MSNQKEIDWSKAPGGFPIWIESKIPGYRHDWHKEEDHGYQDASGRLWLKGYEGTDYIVHRPPKPVWDGGLPPVGFLVADHSGGPVYMMEVVAVEGGMVALKMPGVLKVVDASDIRPIRTPEQIDAEEREKAVEEMLALDPYLPDAPLGMMSRADFCRALHNAGYRKVTP